MSVGATEKSLQTHGDGCLKTDDLILLFQEDAHYNCVAFEAIFISSWDWIDSSIKYIKLTMPCVIMVKPFQITELTDAQLKGLANLCHQLWLSTDPLPPLSLHGSLTTIKVNVYCKRLRSVVGR